MIEKNDLISIIVPVYNTLPYIDRCVKSLQAQRYKHIEILLIDDGSDDGSGDFCDTAAAGDSRIRVIHTENRGASAARNIGLTAVNGKYVAFADSDDYVDPKWLLRLYTKAITSGADITVCGYTLLIGNKSITPFTKKIYGNVSGDDAMLPILTKSGCGGFLWNKLFKTELFDKQRLNETLHFCEDMSAVMSCIYNGASVCFINEPLYFYCKNPNSITETFSDKSFSVIKAYDEMLQNGEISQRIRSILRARRTESANRLISAALRSDSENAVILKEIANEGKLDFIKCKDITFYEKLKFNIRFYMPRLGEILTQMKEKL